MRASHCGGTPVAPQNRRPPSASLAGLITAVQGQQTPERTHISTGRTFRPSWLCAVAGQQAVKQVLAWQRPPSFLGVRCRRRRRCCRCCRMAVEACPHPSTSYLLYFSSHKRLPWATRFNMPWEMEEFVRVRVERAQRLLTESEEHRGAPDLQASAGMEGGQTLAAVWQALVWNPAGVEAHTACSGLQRHHVQASARATGRHAQHPPPATAHLNCRRPLWMPCTSAPSCTAHC